MSKSKVFLWLMLCFIGGVALRSFISVDYFYLLLAGAISLITFFSFSRGRADWAYFAFVIFFLFGAFWYGRFDLKHFKLASLVGQKVSFESKILENPTARGGTQRIIVASDEASGERVLVSAKIYPEFSYGDGVRVSGILKRPENFNGFDYAGYLAKDGIYFTMPMANVALISQSDSVVMRGIYAIENQFERNIGAALAFPHSAFVNGILFGSDADMPKDLKDAFSATGTSHITALSGYNITVIVWFVGFLFSYLVVSKRTALTASIFLITAFVVMTGASSSVVRAAVMGVALLLAKYLGREGKVLNVLVFAAFIMILINPRILVSDVGFQLSFLAVLGLAYLSPYIAARLQKVPEFLKFKESFIATVSAQAAVIPIILYNFHQFSLISPLANMLILPLVPPAMLLGFVAGAFGFISVTAAQLFAYPLWLVTAYQLTVVEYLAHLPFAAIKF